MISANPIPLRLAVVFALIFQPLAAFAQPNTTSLQLIYEVEWGNVDVVTITADWTFSEDAFELLATSRTIGLTDAFRKYRGEAELSGIIEDGRYMPYRLAISGMSKRRSREAFTTWAPGSGSIATQRQPELDLDKVFPLRDRQIDGALDPFSAMLNILDKVAHTGSCKGSARTYDGLRASELTFYDFGSELVAKDRAFAYEGKALVCGLVGKPTGGHQRKSRWRKKQSKPEDIKIFVAEVRQGLFLPVRMQAKSFLGTVTARLVMPSLIYKKL